MQYGEIIYGTAVEMNLGYLNLKKLGPGSWYRGFDSNWSINGHFKIYI